MAKNAIQHSVVWSNRTPHPDPKRPLRMAKSPKRPLAIHRKNLLRGKLIHTKGSIVIHRKGVHRPLYGLDPREFRAVPRTQVYGTIDERIVYKWLSDHYQNFTFQTSLDGGRLEFGGIVAAFVLPDYNYVLTPAGPSHNLFAQQRKDEEQTSQLSEFGFRQWLLDDTIIADEVRFENFMRMILGLGPGQGGDGGDALLDTQQHETDPRLDHLAQQIAAVSAQVDNILGEVGRLSFR